MAKDMDLKCFGNECEKGLKEIFGSHIRFWVWRSYNGVNGFYGNGIINNAVVIWITERPSLPVDKKKEDKFPDWIDKIFYGLLKEEGFENMHLTDFVKIMDDAGKFPTEEELKNSGSWMKKEIELLKVDDKKLIIIANSRNVEAWMKRYLPEYSCIYCEFFKKILRFGKKENREQPLRNTLKEIMEYTL